MCLQKLHVEIAGKQRDRGETVRNLDADLLSTTRAHNIRQLLY